MPNGLGLLRLFDAAYLVALGIWAGVILFSGFGAAPALAGLEPERRTWVDGTLRSRALIWGAVCGAIALPSLVCGAMAVPELRGPVVGLKAGLILTALLLTIHRAARLGRPAAGSPTSPVPGRLPECIVLVILAGLLAAHGFREPPRSQGIQEPGPVERYRSFRDAARRQGTETPADGSPGRLRAETAPTP